MAITIHRTFLPHDHPDASLAFDCDTLDFEIRPGRCDPRLKERP